STASLLPPTSFFFTLAAPTPLDIHPLSLHDALPISPWGRDEGQPRWRRASYRAIEPATEAFSEEALPPMGISAVWSQDSRHPALIPTVSLPTTSTTWPLSAVSDSCRPPASSRPTTVHRCPAAARAASRSVTSR